MPRSITTIGNPLARGSKGLRRVAAFTLVELIVSLAITSIIMLGLGSALMLSVRSIDTGAAPVTRSLTAENIVGRVTSELEVAQRITEYTATSIAFEVPDRDKPYDGSPELIRYEWSGVAGDPLRRSYNGGPATIIARDVHEFDLDSVQRAVRDAALATPALEPATWGYFTGDETPPSIAVLLVVVDDTTPNAQETKRQTLLSSWGYDVTLISESASQAVFDSALGDAHVVYVPETIDATNLGTKLLAAKLGVVNEDWGMMTVLSLADGPAILTRSEIEIRDATHPITDGYALGPLTITHASFRAVMMTDPYADGLAVLAETVQYAPTSLYRPSLGVIEAGDDLENGDPAEGRRVQLPWGANGFDLDELNDDGRTILQRSLVWGAGDLAGTGSATLGYDSIFPTPVLDVKRIQIGTRATLNEDATVTSISAYISKDKDVRLAIYRDDAGEPGALVVESDKFKSTRDPEWNTVDVTPTPLAAGTYWLAVAFSDSNHTYFHDDTGETRYRYHDAVSDGFLPAWGTSDLSYGISVSIYACCTTTP